MALASADSPGRPEATLGGALQTAKLALRERYYRAPDAHRLLRAGSKLIDTALRALWRGANVPPGSALVAVGGYGRGELFPASDVDVMILVGGELTPRGREQVETMVASLWDLGLDVGHSVRSVQACVDAARNDITVQTSLLEARHLAGSKALVAELDIAMKSVLDPALFFKAKMFEQEQRHAKHQDTPYALEPNIKEAPGGLRDLQTIRWIARACGIGARWRDLERHGMMTRAEALQLARSESLLQNLRIRLHFLAGRREDRIVFDHQSALAEQCGCLTTPTRRASEFLMQRYYRAAKAITQLNTILLQNLEARLWSEAPPPPRILNERFEVRGEMLEARSEDLFERDPCAILESFLLMQQHQELRGMGATTMRALWHARTRINGSIRRDPVARRLFLHVLQQPRGIVHEFRRMNQYGVLGRYLPEFGRIVGQMQHDLFHVYTVDQHILMVLRNLRRFTIPELAHEFPLCSQLMAGFGRRWLLYVAALYHDIAKGRGGDHSVLGARDARRFARRHGLEREDT